MQALLVLVGLLFLTQTTLQQGCRRIFGRGHGLVDPTQSEEKTQMEIANDALKELCEGICEFPIPDICPLVALSIESQQIQGFAFLPQYQMLLTAIQPIQATDDNNDMYRVNMTFDYNAFTGEVTDFHNFDYIVQKPLIATLQTPLDDDLMMENFDEVAEFEPELEIDETLEAVDNKKQDIGVEEGQAVNEVQMEEDEGQDPPAVNPLTFILNSLNTFSVQVTEDSS